MRTEPLASVKARLSALVDEVTRTHEQVTVTRNGAPVAVLLAADDYESLLETLDLLADRDGVERLIQAEQTVAAGEATSRDQMAAIMARRRERGE
jgi:antitoxin YefM